MIGVRLALSAAVFVFGGMAAALADDEGEWRHATSLIGTPSHPPGFKHFNYVNPNAPKGGLVRVSESGTFNTFNPILPQGNSADGLGTVSKPGYVYERLMVDSHDQSSTQYGLIAEAVRYPADYSKATYRIRAEAKWHDGEPITAEDVVWSYNKIVELNINQRKYYEHVKSAKVTGEREITFFFDMKGNRELPQIVGQVLVLPKHWWEGKDADGKKRDISKGTLETPMGSGPYRMKSFSAGKTIVYERAPDYWGKDLPVRIGHNNFDVIRYEYFLDDTVEFEAFKADKYDWRTESTARRWAAEYTFPAVKDGRVVREELDNDYHSFGLMLGFIPNLRRDKFKDAQTRQALSLAFDFEEANNILFYGLYSRPDSYFYGTELASSGLPKGKELEILETLRDKVPPEVFTKEFKNPVSGNPQAVRGNLRTAFKLLREAGWKLEGRRLVSAKTGEPFTIELLIGSASYSKVGLQYKASLAKLGIEMSIRVVDSAQYVARVRNRDFDMIILGWAQSLSPGNEQLFFFGSGSADKPQSRNYGGIENPAVDALINRIIFAKNREELVAATRAMDRVLLWNHYIVPGWMKRTLWTARWDRFSHPEKLPYYSIGFPNIWWYDEAKAAKTGAPR